MASVALNELTGAPMPEDNFGYGVQDGVLYLDGIALADEGAIDPDARPFIMADEDWADYLERRRIAGEWLFGPGKPVSQVPTTLSDQEYDALVQRALDAVVRIITNSPTGTPEYQAARERASTVHAILSNMRIDSIRGER